MLGYQADNGCIDGPVAKSEIRQGTKPLPRHL